MRESTEVRVRSVWSFAVTLVVGLAMLGGGGFFLYLEESTPPAHSAHVFTFAGIAILGALLISPTPIFSVVKQTIVVLQSTNLPWVGGKRKDDPPAAP